MAATNAGAFADKLRADLRYAQDLAMTQNKRHRVYFNSAPSPPSGYAIVYDTSGGAWTSINYAQDPAGGGGLSVALGSGQYAGIAITSPASGYVEFNSLGTPAVGGALAFVAGVATITINASAANTVTIQEQTGAVN
jgi:hypothetical protein